MKINVFGFSCKTSFLNLVYHGAGTVVHLLVEKFSMQKSFILKYIKLIVSLKCDLMLIGYYIDYLTKCRKCMTSQTYLYFPPHHECTIQCNFGSIERKLLVRQISIHRR